MVDVVNGIPVYLSVLNSEAALTTGASKIQRGMAGLDLEGDGMLIGVWDEGSVKDHIELGSRVISKEVDIDANHATHVTGTIIAAGINANAKGMAPKAKVTNWYFNNDLAEMAALASGDENSLLLSNHSYGTVTGWTKINGAWHWTGDPSIGGDEDYKFGFYGNKAAALDELANLAPYYTIVWAAGNDRGEPGDGSHPPDCNGGTGYDCIIPEAVAKNIITVGAVNKVLSYTNSSSVVMSTFSSWGPTDDGRIKPDLVGAGVNVFSLSANGTDAYEFTSGTSMATPNVTGSLALLQELYSKLHGGRVMKSATLKALAIQTVKEAGLLPGPDYSYGWGLLDVEAAAKLLVNEDDVNVIVREEHLETGKEFELTLHPVANQKITATIAWNDPAAQPTNLVLDPINLMLVNDLDVKLIAENGSVHYPWLLDPSTPSAQAIKGDNYRDNVEKLEFNLPEAKPYRLVVSHKGQLVNGGQDFSLIVKYQSTLSTGSTLYWIGDSGNWSDNSHWAFSSGGPSALVTPSSNDRVIVDENSFDGIGLDQINLTQSTACGTIKWLRNMPASLNFQGHTLTINKEFSIANSLFTTAGTGTIQLSTSAGSEGNLYFTNSILGNVQLKVDGGNWNLRGNMEADQLEINNGSLFIDRSTLTINKLIANSVLTKELNVDHAEIKIVQLADMDGDHLTFESIASKIKVENVTATLNWKNVSFAGMVEIANATVTLKGNNIIGDLSLLSGAHLLIEPTSSQLIKRISKLEGAAGNESSISSPSKSTIVIEGHFLLCADFVNVTNIDLVGSAKINLGANGTVSNSANWLSQPCESVLFADFDEAYLCVNGFTEFFNKSQGSILTYQWDFGDELSTINISTAENPYHAFSDPGPHIVQLTIGDGALSHSISKTINIKPSLFPKNSIAINSSDLMSVRTSSSYQWFLNEQKIPGATSRSYVYNGDEGVYRVVTYEGVCNLASELITITGLETEMDQIKIYPNPANDELLIEADLPSPQMITLTDLLGRTIKQSMLYHFMTISTNELSNGIYLLKIQNGNSELVRKIVIKHHDQ